MEKYLVIKNFEYFGELLLRKDDFIEVVNGRLSVESSMGQISLDFTKVENCLKKYEILDIDLQEVEEKLDEIRNYKLVLEFKTTKSKSKELEEFLRKEIQKYI